MWLLAGCHLFSSGEISKTCEDVAACVDSGPITGEPSRLLAALACAPCSTDTDTDVAEQYVADVWLVPQVGAAFPQLTQATAWIGPIAYDTRAQMAFVASGGSVVALGPKSDDLASFDGLVDGEIVGMVAVDRVVVLATADAVYRWKPDEGRVGLERVDAGDEGQVFVHLFLDDEQGVWVAGRGNGVDLWKIADASMTLEVEALTTDPELVAAGMFVGTEGAFSGCDRGGTVFRFAGGSAEPIGRPPDVTRAVGCGYDPGLRGHLVLDADKGALLQPDGSDAWGIYASPPNDGRMLAGTIVP